MYFMLTLHFWLELEFEVKVVLSCHANSQTVFTYPVHISTVQTWSSGGPSLNDRMGQIESTGLEFDTLNS